MPSSINLSIGMTFSRWTIIGIRENGKWLCRCSCGTERRVSANTLVAGTSKSCGCYMRETSSLLGAATKRHGLTNTPTWTAWRDMNSRCNNQKDSGYHNYGGRGIKVCTRWESFENFLTDMGEKPKGCSLDRIDVDGHYSPENCRWATSIVQARNRRGTTYLTYKGITKSINDWCDELGIHYRTLRSRLTYGWSVEQAFERPVRHY